MSERHELPLNDNCSHLSFASPDDEFYFKMIAKIDCKNLDVFISSDLKGDNQSKNPARKARNVFFINQEKFFERSFCF